MTTIAEDRDQINAYDLEPDFDDNVDSPILDSGDALVEDAHNLRSHARIAHLVAADFIGRFIHVAGLGWYHWDGKRFVFDIEDKAVTRAVTRTIGKLAPEALGNKDLLADLVKSQTSSGLAGVVRLMSTIEGLTADVEELDADPWLLNTPTGVLDLRELEQGIGWDSLTIHSHDPVHRMTQMTAGAYDPDAHSEGWELFTSRSLPDDGVRRYLQQSTGGLGLIGEQLEHILPILTGKGRNGKGVFYGALMHALGDYAAVASPALFNIDRHATADKPNPALLALRACRLVFMSETAKAAELDSAKIKSLTGGDRIKARGVHSKVTIEFDPSHQLALITNHAPQLPADDSAVWERVINVPWDVVVPSHERDSRLGSTLKKAADAILAWALQGLEDYVHNGLVVPTRVSEATDAYRATQDTVSNFIKERCEDGCADRDSDTTKVLHVDYQKYCRANGVMQQHTLGERDFGTRLDELGYRSKKSGSRRFRQGLRLLPDDVVTRADQRVHQMFPLSASDSAGDTSPVASTDSGQDLPTLRKELAELEAREAKTVDEGESMQRKLLRLRIERAEQRKTSSITGQHSRSSDEPGITYHG